MWSQMGAVGKTPVSRMNGHLKGFRDGAETLAYKMTDLPNEVFGAMRSKRASAVPYAGVPSENEVKTTVSELAVAQQKTWFAYLRSYNGTALECQELEFCRAAQENDGLQSPTARSGGKILR